MKPSDRPGMRVPSSSSSLRKMISSGRRAQLTKEMSVCGEKSFSQRSIDIIGVMPEPAETNRYLAEGWLCSENSPAGPNALTWPPGLRFSNIQRVPTLPACALTVTAIENGRDGEDDSV